VAPSPEYYHEICEIESVSLGFESHGILTAMIQVRYGECVHQGIGGLCLSNSVHDDRRPFETVPLAMDFVVGVMQAAGVGKWEDLPGKTLYAVWHGRHDSMPWNTMPDGLAPLPTKKGKPFLFAEWQARVKAAKAAL
jgi:hypothetical protein